jgi:hypothetical protein
MAALIKIDHSLTSAVGRANAIRFCSRCGEPAEPPPDEAGETMMSTRVCQACGMGMLLSCAREALPGAAAAFLIATVEATVSAVSEAAEPVFGPEQAVLGTRVAELLTSPMGDDRLLRTVTQAAMRPREPEVMPVRGLSANSGAVGMMAARISTCGRPRAALITVEPSDFGRR